MVYLTAKYLYVFKLYWHDDIDNFGLIKANMFSFISYAYARSGIYCKLQ